MVDLSIVFGMFTRGYFNMGGFFSHHMPCQDHMPSAAKAPNPSDVEDFVARQQSLELKEATASTFFLGGLFSVSQPLTRHIFPLGN